MQNSSVGVTMVSKCSNCVDLQVAKIWKFHSRSSVRGVFGEKPKLPCFTNPRAKISSS